MKDQYQAELHNGTP